FLLAALFKWRPESAPSMGAVNCMGCGYIRRGWLTAICPECGTDNCNAESRPKRTNEFVQWAGAFFTACICLYILPHVVWRAAPSMVADYHEDEFTFLTPDLWKRLGAAAEPEHWPSPDAGQLIDFHVSRHLLGGELCMATVRLDARNGLRRVNAEFDALR